MPQSLGSTQKICKVCGFPGPDVQPRSTPRGTMDVHAACAKNLKDMAKPSSLPIGGVIYTRPPEEE